MNSQLSVTEPDGKKRTVELSGKSVSLGRSASNQLSYPQERALSRKHACFELAGGAWVVKDLQSRNGTFVNGQPLDHPHELRHGDEIHVANLRIVYEEANRDFNPEVTFESSNLPALDLTSQVTDLESILARSRVREPTGALELGGRKSAAAALLRVGRELASHRPLSELFEIILQLATETVGAQRGVLMTVEEDELSVRARRGSDFRISKRVRDRVLDDKLSLIIRDIGIDPAWEAHQSIVEQGIRSLMAVPLQTDERVIGLLYLDSAGTTRKFDSDDLELITVMANVAAIRIERARLVEAQQTKEILENELRQAADIQRQCLPESLPETPGFDIAGFTEACRTVGGDYYDFFRHKDGRLAFLVADVAGKGMPASLLMMNLQARVQVLTAELSDPAKIVSRLNEMLRQVCPANRFVTMFLGIMDTETGELHYCNAGHERPLLMHSDGSVEELDEGGAVIGALPGIAFACGRRSLNPGEAVVAFSDGLTEALGPDDEEFGTERLAQVLRTRGEASAHETLELIDQRIGEWLGGRPAHDDVTVVTLIRR